MKKIIIAKNLFGKALADCYHKKQKNSFYVCDEKGEYPLDLKFYISDKLEPHEVKILKYVNGKILEIGCGAGRILKNLQKKGYDTLGFDIDRTAVQLCKEQRIKNVSVESYVNIKRFGIFDTILALNRTIGIAGYLVGIKKLLCDCYLCCSKDGILIFDSRSQPRVIWEDL